MGSNNTKTEDGEIALLDGEWVDVFMKPVQRYNAEHRNHYIERCGEFARRECGEPRTRNLAC
jgi:hypothetical protein